MNKTVQLVYCLLNPWISLVDMSTSQKWQIITIHELCHNFFFTFYKLNLQVYIPVFQLDRYLYSIEFIPWNAYSASRQPRGYKLLKGNNTLSDYWVVICPLLYMHSSKSTHPSYRVSFERQSLIIIMPFNKIQVLHQYVKPLFNIVVDWFNKF